MQASSSRRVQILCATLLCCLKESLVFVSINERKTEEKQNFKRERKREEAREIMRFCVLRVGVCAAMITTRESERERENARSIYSET